MLRSNCEMKSLTHLRLVLMVYSVILTGCLPYTLALTPLHASASCNLLEPARRGPVLDAVEVHVDRVEPECRGLGDAGLRTRTLSRG